MGSNCKAKNEKDKKTTEYRSKAEEVFDEGVRQGHFISRWQRSLYNVPGLTSRPWWSLAQTTHEAELKQIAKNWKVIRDEALALIDKNSQVFKSEDEHLTKNGKWQQFMLYQRGKPIAENCKWAPKTCAIVRVLKDAVNCRRGQIKFSIMSGGTKVYPHCGPTNCRIRSHLGLVVPWGPEIRVANVTKTWKEGEFIVLDDSFEHEVWHHGNDMRLILIVDMYHPDLTEDQKKTMKPI